MKTVHKVCSMLRKGDAVRGPRLPQEPFAWKCKECPAQIETGSHGKGKQGCRLRAEEFVNLVKFGNPWGKKYQHSRKSWPDRSGYTDEFSKKRHDAAVCRK
jgi:hypothetical protein